MWRAKKILLLQKIIRQQTTQSTNHLTQLSQKQNDLDQREWELQTLAQEVNNIRIQFSKEAHERAKEIQDSFHLVEQSRKQLLQDRVKFKQQIKALEQKKKELAEIYNGNLDVLDYNEMFLYNIKESQITTLKDYERAANILANILAGETNLNKVHAHLIALQSKMYLIEDSFIDTFKISPKEYIDRKKIGNTGFSMN